MKTWTFLLLVATCTHAYIGWQNDNGNPTCATSACDNPETPCMDNDNGECLPRTDPTYNVTSGQCRAGTTDCCCTSGCCCPHVLPCQQQNDFKCMPKIDPTGQYCKYDPVSNAYPANCVCSAGTLTCNEDPRKCQTRPPTPVPTPAPTKCNKPVDLLFLVDDSCSIKQKNWPQVQGGIAQIVGKLNVSEAGVHVAAYTFDYSGDVGSHGWPLNKYHTTSDVQQAASTLPGISQKKGTFTCEAMQWSVSNVFTTAGGHRDNAKKIMIIMTDGKPNDQCAEHELGKVSTAVRASGVHVMSIGIGATYDVGSLDKMASKPWSENVFKIKSYNPGEVADQVAAEACK